MKVGKNSLWEDFHKYGGLGFIEQPINIDFTDGRKMEKAVFTLAPQEDVPDEWVMKRKGNRLALPNESSYSCDLSPKGFAALKSKLQAQFQNPTKEGRIPQVGYPTLIRLNEHSTWQDYEAAVMDAFAIIERATKKHIASLKNKAKAQEADLKKTFG